MTRKLTYQGLKILEYLKEKDRAISLADLVKGVSESDTVVVDQVLKLEEAGYVSRFRFQDDTPMVEITHPGAVACEEALSAPRRAP